MTIPEFVGFAKISRLSRDVICSEKIDGTNAQVFIEEDGTVHAGSRTQWITPEKDNYGFAKWVYAHATELVKLGPGRHFGEWWGQGIQRKYDMTEKRWSLFNVTRWCLFGETPQRIPCGDPRIEKYQEVLPACCGLVPVLYRGPFDTAKVDTVLEELRLSGSRAAPGFMKPEGVVVFHVASGVCFKKTIEKDESPKSA